MLTEYQQRVYKECEDLCDKVDKLSNFLYSDKADSLDVTDKNLLKIQEQTMRSYIAILSTRISRF